MGLSASQQDQLPVSGRMKGKAKQVDQGKLPYTQSKIKKQQLRLIAAPCENITAVPPLFTLLFFPQDRVECYATVLPVTLQGQPEETKISPQTQHKQTSSWAATGNMRQPPPPCQELSSNPQLCCSHAGSAQREGSLTSGQSFNSCHWESRMNTNGAVPGAGLQQPPGTDRPHPAPTLCSLFPAALSWNSSQPIHKEQENCPNYPKTAHGPISSSSTDWCRVFCICVILLWLFQLLHSSQLFQSIYPLYLSIITDASLLQPSRKHCLSLYLQICPVPSLLSNPNPTGFIPAPTDVLNFACPLLPDSQNLLGSPQNSPKPLQGYSAPAPMTAEYFSTLILPQLLSLHPFHSV